MLQKGWTSFRLEMSPRSESTLDVIRCRGKHWNNSTWHKHTHTNTHTNKENEKDIHWWKLGQKKNDIIWFKWNGEEMMSCQQMLTYCLLQGRHFLTAPCLPKFSLGKVKMARKMRWLSCHPGSGERAQSRGSTGGEGGRWLAGWLVDVIHRVWRSQRSGRQDDVRVRGGGWGVGERSARWLGGWGGSWN